MCIGKVDALFETAPGLESGWNINDALLGIQVMDYRRHIKSVHTVRFDQNVSFNVVFIDCYYLLNKKTKHFIYIID